MRLCARERHQLIPWLSSNGPGGEHGSLWQQRSGHPVPGRQTHRRAASKLDSSALAPAIPPLPTAAWPLHPWRAGGKERQQEEKNENEKNENEKNENEKNENEKNENEKNEKNEQPAVVATQQMRLKAGKDPTGGQVLGRATTAGRKSPRRVKKIRDGSEKLGWRLRSIWPSQRSGKGHPAGQGLP